jgi:hypothetical protein
LHKNWLVRLAGPCQPGRVQIGNVSGNVDFLKPLLSQVWTTIHLHFVKLIFLIWLFCQADVSCLSGPLCRKSKGQRPFCHICHWGSSVAKSEKSPCQNNLAKDISILSHSAIHFFVVFHKFIVPPRSCCNSEDPAVIASVLSAPYQ